MVDPLENRMPDQPGDLAVSQPEADQLGATQHAVLAFGPGQGSRRQRRARVHEDTLGTVEQIVRPPRPPVDRPPPALWT